MINIATGILFLFGMGCIGFILAKAFIFSDVKYKFLKLIRKAKLEVYITEFLYCPMCIGFWVGIFGELYSGIFTTLYGKIGYIIAAAITSVFALIIDRIVNSRSED